MLEDDSKLDNAHPTAGIRARNTLLTLAGASAERMRISADDEAELGGPLPELSL